GRASAEPTSGVALVWPAAGVTFAWYLTALCEEAGERWKEIGWATALTLLVSWYLNIMSGLSGPISVVFPVGNLIASLLSAWIYLRWGPSVGFHLTGLRDVLVLAGASLVGGTLSSVIGPLYMVFVDGTVPPPFWQLTARTAGST
ncbi:hypothetical protein, partial [Neisseria meningitidis]|uniref:hypothetical protein n=1 Tax=Neisseria meningitidis TaxID=487 RepID=UPI00130463F4